MLEHGLNFLLEHDRAHHKMEDRLRAIRHANGKSTTEWRRSIKMLEGYILSSMSIVIIVPCLLSV